MTERWSWARRRRVSLSKCTTFLQSSRGQSSKRRASAPHRMSFSRWEPSLTSVLSSVYIIGTSQMPAHSINEVPRPVGTYKGKVGNNVLFLQQITYLVSTWVRPRGKHWWKCCRTWLCRVVISLSQKCLSQYRMAIFRGQAGLLWPSPTSRSCFPVSMVSETVFPSFKALSWFPFIKHPWEVG